MHNLTDGQRVVLSHAAQRDDGAANLTETLKGGAATKVAKSLIARKLMREVRAKPGMPVWRRDARRAAVQPRDLERRTQSHRRR